MRLAVDACGERVPWVTGLGATETAPFAFCTGAQAVPAADASACRHRRRAEAGAGRRGARGARPRAERHAGLLARSPRSPAPRSTTKASTRSATPSASSIRTIPRAGSRSRGGIAEDFKLSTGTWVRVGPLRAALLAHSRRSRAGRRRCRAGARRRAGAGVPEPRRLPSARGRRGGRADRRRARRPGRLRRIRGRAVGLQRGAAPAARPASHARCCSRSRRRSTRSELTDKGSINQKAVLRRRAALVDVLYGAGPPVRVDRHRGKGRPVTT